MGNGSARTDVFVRGEGATDVVVCEICVVVETAREVALAVAAPAALVGWSTASKDVTLSDSLTEWEVTNSPCWPSRVFLSIWSCAKLSSVLGSAEAWRQLRLNNIIMGTLRFGEPVTRILKHD